MAKRFFVLGALLILAACTVVKTNVLVPTVTALPETLPVTTTHAPNPPISTTSSALSDVMSYECLDVADHPPSDYILKGTLINNNYDNTDAFLWNNDTKNVYRFPRKEGDRLWQFEVSPDREHILYLHSSSLEDQLIIATATGQTIWSQAVKSYYWNWFDNERLVGLAVPKNGSASLFLLNPFNGEKQELRTEYPDSRLFSIDPTSHWQYTNGGLPIYDPTLTRALYPECDSQCQDKLIRGEGGWPIALWNTETNQVVARIMTTDSYGDTPFWTPDGEQFILATKIRPDDRFPPANEFFAMSREGQLRQLTHFKDRYKEVNISDNYRLSPDGRMVAFWIVAQPSQYNNARLAVMNIETGEVTNLCIPTNSPVDPIWSPDSTQMLIVTQGLEDQSVWRTILVDLVRNYAAQVADAKAVRPVGWMVGP